MKLANFGLVALIAACAAAAACGASQAPEPATPPPAEPAAAPAPAASAAPAPTTPAPSAEAAKPEAAPAPEPAKPAINWDSLSKEQRLEHMKTVVMPKMKELFAAFDAKRYGEMKCVTCHGDGAKNQTFKMPNPKLPKLSFTDGFKKHMAAKPEITKFMMEKVVPEMAALLGEEPYDPVKKKGFGCAECHQVGP